MICKKDVVLWFKELESYKRIDTMCTLLNMCLPFELRFLGTCLEELGRRDSQELRGIELRVNNPADLASDMVACQKGEPTDKKIRRKMALYLALIRACNRTCVTEIFRTLDGWGDRDFPSMTDVDTLQELLLVYTMAAHHPVFSFDQHMKFNEIFEKIKENNSVSDQSLQQQQQQQQHQMQSPPQLQSQIIPILDQSSIMTPTHQDILQQQQQTHMLHITGGQHQHQILTAPIQVLPQGTIPMNYPHLTKLLHNADGSIQHQTIALDGLQQIISIPPDTTNAVMAQHAAANPAWSLRPFSVPPPSSGSSSMEQQQPPQASSPMLSQQSTPSSSRAGSPNRSSTSSGLNMIQPPLSQQQQQSQAILQQQQSQHMRNLSQRIQCGGSMKHVRRPSTETTPPPAMVHTQLEMILPQNLKHVDEVMGSEGSGNQLQTLIRNGFSRTGHHPRMKATNYMALHQQPPPPLPPSMQQQQGNYQTIGFQGLTYSMQNLTVDGGNQSQHLIDGSMMPTTINSHRSGGSDSGSSVGSSGDLSPPETPTLMTTTNSNPNLRLSVEQLQQQQHQQQTSSQQKQQMLHHHHLHHQQQQQQQQMLYGKQMSNLGRINGGRTDKSSNSNNNNNNNNNSNASSSGGSTIIYASTSTHPGQQQQQQQQMFASGNDISLAPSTGSGSGTVPTSSNPSPSSNNHNNNVMMSSGQQYNTNYPYHPIATTTAGMRPLPHSMTGQPPPPPNSFRIPSGFQLPPPPPPNGELLYPAYHHPAGITFLTSAGPPPPSGASGPVSLHSNNVNPMPPVTSLPPHTRPQALTQPTSVSPYALVSGNVNKPLSCYNCGSQTHSGRECLSPSIDDTTRGALYKLDYSLAAQNASAGPTTPTGTGQMETAIAASSSSSSLHHQKSPPQQNITTDTNLSSQTMPPTSGNPSGNSGSGLVGAVNVKSM